MAKANKPKDTNNEAADALVLEHRKWAEGIARKVASAWNLDWQGDGLDGAAMEALIFCSRRYDTSIGAPFKSYARRRIHEATTEAAKNSKGWQKDAATSKRTQRLARAVAADLFQLFPQIRAGYIPAEDSDSEPMRVGIQQMLTAACVISSRYGLESATPDEAHEFKNMATELTALEPIHQLIMWKIYWEGYSLRNLADEWNTDELNVIREHREIMDYLQRAIQTGRRPERPRIRPGLRDLSIKMKTQLGGGIFSDQIKGANNG